MYRSVKFWLTVLSLAYLPFTTALAVKPNAEQPITIEADRARISEKEGVSTYSGHVVLSQGGIRINADSIIVHHEQGKLSHVTAIGSPVTYFQQGDAEQEAISGEANTMEYFAVEQRLLLLDNAKLSQGGNVFSGNRIDYDTQREVVTAAVSEAGTQRVQVTIQPKTLNIDQPEPASETDQQQNQPQPSPSSPENTSQ